MFTVGFADSYGRAHLEAQHFLFFLICLADNSVSPGAAPSSSLDCFAAKTQLTGQKLDSYMSGAAEGRPAIVMKQGLTFREVMCKLVSPPFS